MESFKLSSLTLVLTFLLLAAVAVVAGDELTTFIVHVQPQKNQMLATADDRNTWYRSLLPEDGRLRGSSTRTTTSPAASWPSSVSQC